jgi:hypothetical protein
LPALHYRARVDCLNELSGSYLVFNSPIRPVPNQNIIGDTATYYANLAYEEAIKINYIHGIAESLSYKGEIEIFSDDFPLEEELPVKPLTGTETPQTKEDWQKLIII